MQPPSISAMIGTKTSLIQQTLGLWRHLTAALDALQPLAALLARNHTAQVFFL